ncbi:ClpX C4-type zinc finger protein [Pelagibius sp. Alg239-R121]|uniref:ClpX C4-type zinc finger protein n=1 Tax=Pelagibius sp. Alg239-R121 TaxID=2993448 RepID=UPI0024A794A1|nr:ClpX C4-type zinc finger protein [Pelagibius sp. Alg239-R121]
MKRSTKPENPNDSGRQNQRRPSHIKLDNALFDAANMRQCAFCFRTRPEVEAFLVGPRRIICTDCVEKCASVLANGGPIGAAIIERERQALKSHRERG